MLAFETVEKIESSALACTSVFLNVLVLDKIIGILPMSNLKVTHSVLYGHWGLLNWLALYTCTIEWGC